jgi:hypothetical protein
MPRRAPAPPQPAQRTCTGPACTREPRYRDGLCSGHHRQRLLGRPLAPLRGPGGRIDAEPRQRLGGLRLSARAMDALGEVGASSPAAAARLVLEAWAAGTPLARVRS